MRKPVRSTVANRKYFQGGGLAPMKPAAPEEAVGIMASSQPLVDMVAQSAGNPQGGMSPLNFNQGGINFNTDQLSRRLTPNIEVPELKELRGSRLRRFFYGPKMERFLNTKVNLPIKSPLKGIGQFFLSDENPNQEFTVQRDFPTASPSQLATLDALVQMNPDNKNQIYSLGKKIITDNKSDATGENLANLMKSEQLLLDKAKEKEIDDKFDKEAEEANKKARKEAEGKVPEIDPIKKADSKKTVANLKAEQDAETNIDDVAIPGGKDASDKNIETEEFIFPGGRKELEKEKNVINQNTDPNAEQTSEDRLGMLMKRFTDAAPKYEGLDSGLAIMQMGAIMAGGTSPNAVKNIADALTVTSEKLIKDKAKRDEFNRQLNLSALQYGLGEISKEDAQKRQDDRNFITLVASKDGTNPLTGEKISKGENIRVSMTDMLSKDIPSMFKDKDMYVAELDAAAKAKKAVTDLINERRKELILSDTAAVKQQELYNEASKQYIQSTAGLKFVDNALITLSEGEVTGIKGGVNDLTLKIFSALGLKAGHKFKDKKLFEDSVKKAFQKLIPTALGGVQSANSISDRDVQFLANAYIEASILKEGTFNLVSVNEDVLKGKLQTLRDTFIQNQNAGLRGMRQVNDFLSDRTRPGGGSAQTYISEGEKRVRDFREKEIANISEIKLEFDREDEDGTKIFKIPGLKSG
tara:strand:+ start:54 stop:2141 length:2088 start_codon:yes stop_codon:yes gene_type:complete